MALLWVGLNGGDASSWIIGVPAVILAAGASLLLMPSVPWRLSAWGMVAFAGFFFWESLRGGLDVARRAIRPALWLDPGFVDFASRLPAGPALRLFCGCICLLPGTSVVAAENRLIRVHALDVSGGVAGELRGLEERVAGLFGIALANAGGGAGE